MRCIDGIPFLHLDEFGDEHAFEEPLRAIFVPTGRSLIEIGERLTIIGDPAEITRIYDEYL